MIFIKTNIGNHLSGLTIDEEAQPPTWGFAKVGHDVRTISSGAYPNFGSGLTSDIGH